MPRIHDLAVDRFQPTYFYSVHSIQGISSNNQNCLLDDPHGIWTHYLQESMRFSNGFLRTASWSSLTLL